jgi:nitrate/TMAO reductase-like tetraheme cytochrome c subunit
MAEKLPRALTNPVSYFGAAVAVISFVVLVTLILTHVFLAPTNPYVGVVTYLVFPVFLVIGVLLIPVGMIWDWARRRKGKEAKGQLFPVVDFNLPHHRNAFLTFIIGAALFVMVSAIGSYQAYNFTESPTFCGKLCHEVMKPEYMAYQASPHARVSCAECHIGAGAGWFVKSKLSGLYQVYATLADKYPQPIPTPVKNLRPSRDTCEECHWPEQFYGSQQKVITHYLPDENNTKYELNLLIKIGGGNPLTSKASGVHWHTYLTHDIEFISTDERQQVIPWFRAKDRLTGEVRVYVDEENPPSEELLATAKRHLMDCMDCHNRPTHIFRSPKAILNEAIAEGRIPKDLPMIKYIGVEALSQEYETTDEALDKIAESVWNYYKENYPEIVKTRSEDITNAVHELQARFQTAIFPEMKVNWKAYPDNIGHLYFPGCFRCHDGKHVTRYGERLSADCKTCHIILSIEVEGDVQKTLDPDGLDFQHPVDIDEAWKEMLCYECHSE